MADNSTTERIALEVRAQVKHLDSLKDAEKHLTNLLKLQANFNKQGLSIAIKGGTDQLDKAQVKVRALREALNSVGESKLGEAISKDLSKADQAFAKAKQKLSELAAQRSKIERAGEARPNADLSGQVSANQKAIDGYQRVLKSAGALQTDLSASAREFVSAEAAVGKSSQSSGSALAEQTRILADKKTAFGAAKTAADQFTASENAQAQAAQTNTAQQKAAAGQLREITKEGKIAAKVFATGSGQTRRQTFKDDGSLGTTTDTTDYEKRYKLELDSIKARSSAANSLARDDQQRISLLRDEANQYGTLASRIDQAKLSSTKLYADTQSGATKAEAAAQKLEHTLAKTAKLANFTGRADSITDRGSNQRLRGSGDPRAQAEAYRSEASALRELSATMKAGGQDGEKLYQKIGRAAGKAEANVVKIERGIYRQIAASAKAAQISGYERSAGSATQSRIEHNTLSGNDQRYKIHNYEREAVALREIGAAMVANGHDGEDSYTRIEKAARKASIEAAKLRRIAKAEANDQAVRRNYARATVSRVSDLQNQGFQTTNETTVKSSDGTAKRTIDLSRETEQNGQAFRETRRAVIELDSSMQPLNATFTETRKQLKAVAERTSWATRNFLDNTKTVVTWAASVLAYQAAFRGLSATTRSVIELQRESAVLGTIFQGERSEVERLKDQLLELATATGRSGKESLDAGVRFARLGLTRRQILEAVTVSLKAANVAEIEAGEAAEHLSAIMASWGLQANQLYTVLTRLNNISNQYNTTNRDLLQGVARVGTLAKESGLGFEELVAVIDTGVGKTGRSGAEFGNAIKSIIVSLANPKIQGKLDTLFDFDVKNQAGQLKSMDVIIRDLATSYQSLTKAQQQEMLQIVGKKQQASRLAVVLKNYTQIQKNLAASLEDGTNTESENADIRATLLSQLTSLKSAYESLAVSSAGAFEGSTIAGRISVIIRSLTALIQILEKGSGLFPILAAAAGLLFFRFLRGAIVLSATNGKAGLLVNTMRKLTSVMTDLGVVMRMQERRMVLSGSVMSGLILRLRALATSANGAAVAIANIGRIAVFTLGPITALLGSIILFTGAFKAIGKLSSAWENYQKRQEEARREALGFSKDLNSLADAAKRIAVLKNVAVYIRDIVDSASQSDLRTMVDDMLDIGKFDAAQIKRINTATNSGDKQALKIELDSIMVAQSTAELTATDKIIGQINNDIAKTKELINATETALANHTSSWRNLWNIGGKNHASIKEDLKEQHNSLEKLNSDLDQLRDKTTQLRGTIRAALVDEDQVKSFLDNVSSQADAIASLVKTSDATGDSFGKQLANAFAANADQNYLADIQSQFDATTAALERDIANNDPGGLAAAFQEQRDNALGALAELEEEAAAIRAKMEPESNWGTKLLDPLENTKPRKQLRKDLLQPELDAINERIALGKIAIQQNDAENASMRSRSERGKELAANLELENKRRAETESLIKQQLAAREKERQAYEKQIQQINAYATRLQHLNRIQQEGQARLGRYSHGGDETERLKNQQAGLTQEIERSTKRLAYINSAYKKAKADGDPEFGKILGDSAQNELVRAAGFANQLETTRNQLIERRYRIESDIIDAKRRQNEEASKALGLAGREDQLRAAFLARYASENGDQPLSEEQFQFLGTDTRQAVNAYTPGLAPASQQNDVARLEREQQSYAKLDATIAALDATLAKFATDRQSAIPVAAQGSQAPQLDDSGPPLAGQPISINVAQNAVVIDIAEPMKLLAQQLTTTVTTRLESELADMRTTIHNATRILTTAGARGTV